MDWVKLYEVGQIGEYPNKRILFRMDLPWPANWEAYLATSIDTIDGEGRRLRRSGRRLVPHR